MELNPIQLDEHKSDKLHSSVDGQILVQMYGEFYEKIGFCPPWIGYYVVKEDKVVGSCGFVGKPADGRVEIAYWTFSDFEGQGVASYSCKEMIRIAKESDPHLTITAKTQPGHNASTSILQKNGFSFVDVVQDHEIGDAWLWVLQGESN